jgi:voltage-gated potassium channel
MDDRTRLGRYELRSEWPLAGVALLFLAVFSVDVLQQPRGRPTPSSKSP